MDHDATYTELKPITSIIVCMPLLMFNISGWLQHILFMKEHEKGLGRTIKHRLAFVMPHTYTYYWFTVIKRMVDDNSIQQRGLASKNNNFQPSSKNCKTS